ncbi:MAG: ATP-binding protein [Pseudomonadota bacterium]
MEDETPPNSGSRLGALAWVTVILAAPMLVVAGIGVWAGQLGLWAAAGIAVPVIIGLGFLAWLYVGQVQRIDHYVRGLTEQADPPGESDIRRAEARPISHPPNLNGWGMARLASLSWQLALRYDGRVRALSAKLDELGAVAETIADPLLLVGQDRRVILDNRAARQRFGFSLMNRDVADGFREPDVLSAVDAVLAGDEAQTIVLDSLDATAERVFEMRVAPFPRSQVAERQGALLSLHDITAIKRSEQMRADFVANASHELRNPLSILSGYVETLQTTAKEDAESQEQFLGVMAVQADRMTRLINDLLSLSRVEIDELTRPSGTVPLEQVIATVVDYQQIKADAKKMTLRVECPDLPDIVGDGHQLEQVFTNLLDNAVNYGAPETEVQIKARRRASDEQVEGPVIDVSVRDFGEGIAREHISRLTERFYRVDKARSRTLGGTGLGLAIVKHIIARHRGRLIIQSDPDAPVGERGSTFTVVLPVDLTES